MEAIILAGGKGTRLWPLTDTVPKPMVPVNGRPFLEYLLLLLKAQGVTRVILSVGYLSGQIESYFPSRWQGLVVDYVHEDEPLGTGGAIRRCLRAARAGQVFVINGDTYCRVDLRGMLDLHRRRQADISIALKELHDFDRYGTVDVDPDGRIIRFNEKRRVARGLINTGNYCLNRDLFDGRDLGEKFSLEVDFLQPAIGELRAVAYEVDGYFIDIGIPEDYQRFQREIDAGIS